MITKKEFLDKIDLFKKTNNILLNKEAAEELRIMFHEYLNVNCYDSEIWMKFALMLYRSSLNENLGGIKCLEKILTYDSENIDALLINIYINHYEDIFYKYLFEKLLKIKTENKPLMSLIEYTKSWYYLTNNSFEYEKSLINSIELCDKYLWNYIDLGHFYVRAYPKIK